MTDAVTVREAACVLRGIHAACAVPDALPAAPVLRLAALRLRLGLPDALRTRDVARMADAGVNAAYAAKLFRCFPGGRDADRLGVAIKLLLARVHPRHCRAALDVWDLDAYDRVARDPYSALFELKGTLDDAEVVAAAAGLDDFDARVREHAKWLLRVARRDGHTMLPTTQVVHRVWVRARVRDPALTVDAVRMALVRAREAGALDVVGQPFDDDEGLADPEACVAERRIHAEIVRRLDQGSTLGEAPAELAGGVVCLTAEQRAAVATVFGSSLSIVTGGPGTGKSTLIRALVAHLGEGRCLITAPTGRAARRVGGSTVHSASGGRLLARRPLQETSKADVPADLALMVVDEGSMLTTELMLGVFNLAPAACHVVLVGDADQLPPVGAGNAFIDLLESGAVPAARLDHNHRCATDVQRAAAAVLRGEVPDLATDAGGAVELVEARSPGAGMRAVVVAVGGAAPGQRQVLTPHNADRAMLNRALQSAVRGVPVTVSDGRPWGLRSDGSPLVLRTDDKGISTLRDARGDVVLTMPVDQALAVTRPRQPLLPDDLVMALKNQNKKRLGTGELSACNGDVGVLVRADPKPLVRFEDGVSEFPKADDWLTLAYAATVHKFQGSECDQVVLPVYNPVMWDRQLLYTAMTRAKSRVVLVGTSADLKQIVGRTRPKRHSVLAKLFCA